MNLRMLPALALCVGLTLCSAAAAAGQPLTASEAAQVQHRNVTTLANALEWLTTEKGVRVTWSSDRVDGARTVSLGDTSRTGPSILSDVFRQVGIAWRVTDSGHVVVTGSEASREAGAISGRVTSEAGDPIEGVLVVVRGANRSSLTGPEGRYRIDDVASGLRTILVSDARWEGRPLEVRVGDGAVASADFVVSLRVFELAPLVVQADPRYASNSTVSATKLPTEILDVPQSIQVVPGRLIEDQQALRVVDALRNVSGIAPEAGFGQTQDGFYVRGFQTQPVTRNGFRRLQFGGYTDMANVERLEVLKGPASVLYGTGSPGGVVNVITKTPRAERFRSLDVSTGSRGFWRLEGDVSGTLGQPGLRYRVVGATEQGGTWQDDADSDRFLIAPSLEWQATERLNFLFDAQWNRQNRTQISEGGLVIDGELLELPITRSLTVPYGLRETEDRLLGARVQYDVAPGLAVRVHHRRLDVSDDLLDTFLAGPEDAESRVWGRWIYASEYDVQEVYTQLDVLGEFTTGGASHRFLFGAELGALDYEDPASYFDGHTTIDILNPAPDFTPPPWDGSSPGYDRAEQELSGFYLQDLIEIGDRVQALAGIRYDDVVFTSFTDRTNDSASEVVQTAWSPRVGLVVRPIESVALFAGWAKSFDPTTRLDAFGDRLPSEQGTQVEGGVKAELADGRMTLTAAAYRIVRDSIDIRVSADVDPRRVIAVGQETSRGFEFDLAGTLWPGGEGVLTYGYTDAEITEDLRFPIGSALANVPRHSASAWLSHRIQGGSADGLGFGLGFVYAGARPMEIATDPFELDAYTLVNGALFYRLGGLDLALNANNLFDTRYFESTQGTTANYYGAPRTINLTVGVGF